MKENEVKENAVPEAAAETSEVKSKSKAELYDEEIEKYKKELDKVKDLDVLQNAEKEVIKLIEENEKVLAEKVYELPESTEFRGTKVSRAKVYEYVFDILNGMEMNWRMTLTMYDFLAWWKETAKKNPSGLPYQYYDVTLKLLGEQQYKGYEGMRRILIVNSLFAPLKDQYADDLAYTYYLADKHNVILTRMDAIHALEEPLK